MDIRALREAAPAGSAVWTSGGRWRHLNRGSPAGSPRELVGHVAIVTGGGRGLGRAMALAECGGLHLLISHGCRGMRFVSETFTEVPTTFWGVAARTWRLVVDTNVTGPVLMPTRRCRTCAANNRLLTCTWLYGGECGG